MFFRMFIVALSVDLVCTGFIVAEGSKEKISGDDEALEKQVDQIFAQWDRADSPGCALTIIRQGKVIYERGYGTADLGSGTPIAPTTAFDIGSMSKQFTAACVVLLAESGKLSLDDDIRKYLPRFRDYGHTITIRHLLYHTSGIRDYPWLMALARTEFSDADEQKRQEIFELLTRQRQLYFAPGEDHYYSNSNYFLLGLIVERVSGTSLGEFAARQMFEPLGMKHTLVRQDQAQAIENRAIGYVQNAKGEFQRKGDRIVFGAGGVYSTTKDLFLWDQNFRENRIGEPKFNATMLTRGKLNNGRAIKYACGLEYGEYKGLQTVGFMGYMESFATYMVRFPKQEFSIICLANLGSVRPNRLALKVADLYLAGQFSAEEQPSSPKSFAHAAVAIESRLYDVYVGDYRSDFGLLMTFSREAGQFLMQAGKQPKVELIPQSERDFFIKGADVRITFRVGENGRATGITLNQGGNKMMAQRVASQPALPLEQLQEFVGDYFNDELQVTYTVALEGAEVSVKAPRDFVSKMRHIKGDEFSMSRGYMIFHRNDRGDVNGFLLDIKTERLSFQFIKKAAP